MAHDEPTNVNRQVRATGKDEARQLIAMINAAFPDARFSLVQRVRDEGGDRAFVWSVEGTHTGEVGGFAPTGAPAKIVAVVGLEPREDSPAP